MIAHAGMDYAKANNFEVGDTSVDADGKLHIDTKAVGDSALDYARKQARQSK